MLNNSTWDLTVYSLLLSRKPLFFFWQMVKKVLWQRVKPWDEQVLKLCSSKQSVRWPIKAWHALEKVNQWLHRASNGLISAPLQVWSFVMSLYSLFFFPVLVTYLVWQTYTVRQWASETLQAIYIFHKMPVLHKPISYSQKLGATRRRQKCCGRTVLGAGCGALRKTQVTKQPLEKPTG